MVGTAVVLAYIVDHGGCDDLEAVRVAALGQVAVVSGLLHLEDLGQRDFLRRSEGQRSKTRSTSAGLHCAHTHHVRSSLKKQDLAKQTC